MKSLVIGVLFLLGLLAGMWWAYRRAPRTVPADPLEGPWRENRGSTWTTPVKPTPRDVSKAEMAELVRAYRATGLPWTATDLAPKPPIAPAQNAVPPVRDLLLDFRGWRNARPAAEAVKGEDWTTAASLFAPQDDLMTRFAHAMERPRADFGRDLDRGASLLFPEYADFKKAAIAFAGRAELRSAQGDPEGAADDLETTRRIACVVAADGFRIALFVRLSCEKIADEAAQRAAARNPSHAARFLGSTVASVSASAWEFERMLRCEAYNSLATTRNLALQTDSPATTPILRNGLPTDPAGRAEIGDVLGVWAKIGAEMKRHRDSPLDLGAAIDRVLNKERDGATYVKSLLSLDPEFAQAAKVVAEQQARHELTIAYLRALDTHHRTGRWPEPLVTSDDPFGNPYIGLRTENGFRIFSGGINGGGKIRQPGRAWGRITEPREVVLTYPPQNR